MSAVLAALVTGLLSAIGTYLVSIHKVRRDLEARYDESLRNLRLDAYCELWEHTKVLAAFRDGTPTRDEIKQLSTSLMNWYFDKGGLYLSKETRDACVALQRALRVINQADRDQIVDVDTFDHLRELASELRSMMTYDVGTRKPFSMRERSDGTRDWQPLDTKSVPRNAHSSERWIVDNW